MIEKDVAAYRTAWRGLRNIEGSPTPVGRQLDGAIKDK
jgi:hypothetical protein